jgi:hypothetical protein
VVVWHPIGVSDGSAHFPPLREIENTLYDAALLLSVWVVLTSLF